MIVGDKYFGNFDHDFFCTTINRVIATDHLYTDGPDAKISASKIGGTVKSLFKEILFENEIKTKLEAASRLRTIFASWYKQDNIPYKLIMESKSDIIQSLIFTNYEELRELLFQTFLYLLKVINKNNVNKWKVISELVITCVSTDDQYLNQMIQVFLNEGIIFFGKNRRHVYTQYKNLFIACFKVSSKKPVVGFFVSGIMADMSRSTEYKFDCKTLSKLVPHLIDALEIMIVKNSAYGFIENLLTIFFSVDETFGAHVNQIVPKIIKLTHMENIHIAERIRVTELLMIICTRFPQKIDQYCFNHIPTIIDDVMYWLTECYQKHLVNWLDEFFKFGKIFPSSQSVVALDFLERMCHNLEHESMYTILNSKVTTLLKSSNWKFVVTGVDLLGILIKEYGKKERMNPLKILETLKLYIMEENVAIVCSAINACLNLYCVFKEEYKYLPSEVLFLILSAAETHGSIIAQSSAIICTQELYLQVSILDSFRFSKSINSIFIDLLNAMLEIDQYTVFNWLVNVVTKNIVYFLTCITANDERDYTKTITLLLNAITKSYSFSMYDKLVHQLLKALNIALQDCPNDFLDETSEIILKYVEDFIKNPKLPKYEVEIPPCFFQCLLTLSAHKPKDFVRILPLLEISIIKFFCVIFKIYIDPLLIKGYDKNTIQQLSICSECFSKEFYPGHAIVLHSMTKTLANYAEKSSLNIKLYAIVFQQILKRTDFIFLHSNLVLVSYTLLNRSIQHGDIKLAKDLWNNYMNESYMRTMNLYWNPELYVILYTFVRCITIPNFDVEMDFDDIKNFCSSLKNFTIISVSTYCEALKIQQKNPESTLEDILGETRLTIIERDLTHLETCIHMIMGIYKERMSKACFPLIKMLLTEPNIKCFSRITKLLFSILNDILTFVPYKDVEYKEISASFISLCVYLLEVDSDEALLEYVTNTAKIFKRIYPATFKKHISMLDRDSKSKFKKLLKK